MGIRHAQQATHIVGRINVGHKARWSIGHRGREHSVIQVTAADCIAEEVPEHIVPMKPGARDSPMFDWKECLAMLDRQSSKLQISRLSEKRFKHVRRPGIQTAERLLVLNELPNSGG